jgi:hypothetical protein
VIEASDVDDLGKKMSQILAPTLRQENFPRGRKPRP